MRKHHYPLLRRKYGVSILVETLDERLSKSSLHILTRLESVFISFETVDKETLHRRFMKAAVQSSKDEISRL